MTYPFIQPVNTGGSYARAGQAGALAEGLRNIGVFLLQQKQQKEDEQARLSEYAAERGGGTGPVPMTPAVAARPAVTQAAPEVPFTARQGGSAVMDEPQDDASTRPVTTSPAVAGQAAAPDSRYVKIGSGDAIGYVLRPDQRPENVRAALSERRLQDEATARARYMDAEGQRQRAAADEAEARANFYNRRPTGGSGGTGRMTRPQAQAVLRRDPQYYDFAGQALKSPIEIKLAEDSLMGGTMAPRAPVDTTTPAPAPTSGGFHPLDAIGRVLGMGSTSRPAPAGAPASGSSASPTVAPRQPVAAPAPAPSANPSGVPSMPQGMATDKIPVAQQDYDDIVAHKGADYAQRYYQVKVM